MAGRVWRRRLSLFKRLVRIRDPETHQHQFWQLLSSIRKELRWGEGFESYGLPLLDTDAPSSSFQERGYRPLEAICFQSLLEKHCPVYAVNPG